MGCILLQGYTLEGSKVSLTSEKLSLLKGGALYNIDWKFSPYSITMGLFPSADLNSGPDVTLNSAPTLGFLPYNHFLHIVHTSI